MWDLKSEPGLIEKFAQIWGTEELLVSYGKMSTANCLPIIVSVQNAHAN